jgi:toxin FitB
MRYLADANLLSEPTKPRYNMRAADWIKDNEAQVVTSVIVMAEIWRGVDGLPAGRKKTSLMDWFDRLRNSTTVLDWTIDSSLAWAEMVNDIKRRAFTIGILDTMIAATAKVHGLTVATRNVDDFRRCGVPVVNPFE